MRGLSLALLREHKWAYLGCFASIALSSVLVTSSLNLLAACLVLDGTAGLTGADAAQAELAGKGLGSFAGLTAFVAVLVSVTLIASTVGFVVQGRRRELALLRLSGAGRPHLIRLILAEAAVLGALAGLIGALVAVPAGRGYLALFSAFVSMPLPRGLTVYPHPEALLGGVALTVLVTLWGAFGPARRVSRVEPVEALSDASARRRAMSLPRWIAGGLAGVGVLAMFAISPSLPVDAFAFLALGQGCLALIALVLLAPVVVGPVAAAVCGLISRVAPGSGLLAQGHSGWDRARTSALANPAFLLLAVPGVFYMTFFGLIQGLGGVELRQLHAQVVAEQETAAPSLADLGALRAVPGVADVARFGYTAGVWTRPDEEGALQVSVDPVDLAAYARLADLRVTAGSLDAVHGNDIAAGADYIPLGTTFPLTGPAGRTVQVRVVAVLGNSPLSGSYLVDAASFDLQGAPIAKQTTLVGLAPGADAAAVRAGVAQAAPGASVSDTVSWNGARIERSNSQTTSGLFMLIGGSCLLALLAIAVSIMTSLRERRGEFALARRSGAGDRSLHATTLIETAVILVVAMFLGAVVTGVVWARIGQNFVAQGLPGVPMVPLLLGWFALAGAVMGLVATLGGTAWALRSIRTE